MISVLMCGNRGVRDGVILSLLSMVKHTDREIKLYIATMDLSELNPVYIPLTEGDRHLFEAILKKKNPLSSVTLLDTGEHYRRELLGGKNEKSSYTPYAMIRLLAYLYELGEKILYIDADVMFLSDVGELFDTDIEGYQLAGVKDYYGSRFISPRYMNSGVMLWNMKRLREDGVLSAARELCYKRKMLLPDQTALNRFAKEKLYLPRRFNEQQDARPDTVIQHFSMRIRWFPFGTVKIKPWQPELLHEKLGIYYYDDVIAEWQRYKNESEAAVK